MGGNNRGDKRARRTGLPLLGLLLVAAVLVPAPAFAAGTVTIAIQGEGRVTGDGIDCVKTDGVQTGDCSEFYDDEVICDPGDPCPPLPQTVSFTASPGSSAFSFIGWSNCDAATAATCDETVNVNKTITASFADQTPPILSGLSPTGVRRGYVELTVQAADNDAVQRVEFRVRGALVAAPTVAPYSYSLDTGTLPDGPASLSARAIDLAGNERELLGSFTIDNTAPVVEMISGPESERFQAGTTQTWQFTVDDPHLWAVDCSLVLTTEQASFAPCSGGSTSHSVSDLPEGHYAFTLRARDALGNATGVLRYFRIDATAPQATITGGPADGATVAPGTVTWPFYVDDIDAVGECRVYPTGITAPSYGACTDSRAHVVSGLGDGAYTFEVRARDLAGNVGPAVSRRVVVATAVSPTPTPTPTPAPPPTPTPDTTAPDTMLDKKPRARIVTRSLRVRVKLAFHATESGVTFRCKLDRKAWRACTSPKVYRVSAGRHVIRVRSVDAAGNADPTPAVRKFRVIRRR